MNKFIYNWNNITFKNNMFLYLELKACKEKRKVALIFGGRSLFIYRDMLFTYRDYVRKNQMYSLLLKVTKRQRQRATLWGYFNLV